MKLNARVIQFLPAAFLVVTAACSNSAAVREDRGVPRMRYLNLPVIFDHLATRDEQAATLKARGENLKKIIRDLEEKLAAGGGGIPEPVLRNDLKKYAGEIKALDDARGKLREKYYEFINRAVTEVARKMDIDYVFNIGDDLIYSRRENDITELVLQELTSIKNRNAPHSK